MGSDFSRRIQRVPARKILAISSRMPREFVRFDAPPIRGCEPRSDRIVRSGDRARVVSPRNKKKGGIQCCLTFMATTLYTNGLMDHRVSGPHRVQRNRTTHENRRHHVLPGDSRNSTAYFIAIYAGAAAGAEWALNNPTYLYMNSWFHYVKLYAATAGCIGFLILKYHWGSLGKAEWFKCFLFVIVAINILIAVVSDFESAARLRHHVGFQRRRHAVRRLAITYSTALPAF